MKKILVPVDYSEVCQSAVNYALKLAPVLNSEITLFHAMQVPVPPAEIPPVYITGPELETEETNKLRNYTDKLRKENPDARIAFELRYDFVKDSISSMADAEGDYKLIIMGITPAGSFMQSFPGGTAVNLINEVSIPLLIVPQHAQYKSVKRIIVALGKEALDYKTIFRPLRELALLHNAEVHFVHIIKSSDPSDHEHKNRVEDQLSNVFKGLSIHFRYPVNEELYKGINEQVTEMNADMLVMLHHKRGFLASLFSTEHTRRLAYLTTVPLMVIPVD